MGKKLAVVLGAGASFGCVPETRNGGVDFDWRPPLASGLFLGGGNTPDQDRRFYNVLRQYPRAESLASDIRVRIGRGDLVEVILREFRDREDNVVRQYQEVPYYLQDLLGAVSTNFTTAPDNLNYLVRAILKPEFDRVAFITLNYDLLLERALDTAGDSMQGLRAEKGLSWYTGTSDKWILVKLHGSVDWATPLEDVEFPRGSQDLPSILAFLETVRVGEHEIGGIEMLRSYHQRVLNHKLMYPALAVPVDEKIESVCPREHFDELEVFLAECRNVLVVGTAGKDEDLLSLLRPHRQNWEGFAVVAGNTDEADSTYKSILGGTTLWDHHQRCGTGFTEFVASGQLDNFLDGLKT